MTQGVVISLAALAGACFGSYGATLAVRRARAEGSVFGRSHCDGCGVSLGFVQTLPVLSFVRFGGHCEACGARIDPMHPIGELAGAAILAASFAFVPFPRSLMVAALGLGLLFSALIDARTRKLPDGLTLVIAALGAALAVQRSFDALWIGAVAAVASFVMLEAVRRLFLLIRREPGLGFGDVKLVAALALWLGLATSRALAAAAASTLIAIALVKSSDGSIAFGPGIALAGWIVGVVMEVRGWL